MENRVPLPTDNIYKFYALFGLFVCISVMASVLYLQQTTNAFLADAYVAYAELASLENPTPPQAKKKEIIERRIDVAIQDKGFFSKVIGIMGGIGLIMMAFGFHRWHFVIQPKQDKLLDLQIQKAQRELKSTARIPLRGPRNGKG